MLTLADILWLEKEAERRLEANENAQYILEDFLTRLLIQAKEGEN